MLVEKVTKSQKDKCFQPYSKLRIFMMPSGKMPFSEWYPKTRDAIAEIESSKNEDRLDVAGDICRLDRIIRQASLYIFKGLGTQLAARFSDEELKSIYDIAKECAIEYAQLDIDFSKKQKEYGRVDALQEILDSVKSFKPKDRLNYVADISEQTNMRSKWVRQLANTRVLAVYTQSELEEILSKYLRHAKETVGITPRMSELLYWQLHAPVAGTSDYIR